MSDTTLVLTTVNGFRVGDRELVHGDEVTVADLYDHCRDRNTVENLVRAGIFTPRSLLEDKTVAWNGSTRLVDPLSGYRLDEWLTGTVIADPEQPDKDARGNVVPPGREPGPFADENEVTVVDDADLDALDDMADPDGMTVAEAKAYIEAHPEHLHAFRDAERAGKDRSTLVEWLEEREA